MSCRSAVRRALSCCRRVGILWLYCIALPALADADFHALVADGVLTASGTVSSAGNAEILNAVTSELYTADSRLELTTAPAPPGWSLVTEQLLRALAATDGARATLDGNSLTVSGLTRDAERWQVAAAALRRVLLPGMQFVDRVSPLTSDASFAELCRRQYDGALNERSVEFSPDSSDLGPGAEPLLDALIEIAADCPDTRIVVTGHTDGSGDETDNRELSKSRADAVVDYLAAHGVAEQRLTAIGAGSTEPLVSGSGPRARVANRRISFRIEIAD